MKKSKSRKNKKIQPSHYEISSAKTKSKSFGNMKKVIAAFVCLLMIFSVIYIGEKNKAKADAGTGELGTGAVTDNNYVENVLEKVNPQYNSNDEETVINIKVTDTDVTFGLPANYNWENEGYIAVITKIKSSKNQGETVIVHGEQLGKSNIYVQLKITTVPPSAVSIGDDKKLVEPDVDNTESNTFFYGKPVYNVKSPDNTITNLDAAGVEAAIGRVKNNSGDKDYTIEKIIVKSDDGTISLGTAPDYTYTRDWYAVNSVNVDNVKKTEDGKFESGGTITVDNLQPNSEHTIGFNADEGTTATYKLNGADDVKTGNTITVPAKQDLSNVTDDTYAVTVKKGDNITETFTVVLKYDVAKPTFSAVKCNDKDIADGGTAWLNAETAPNTVISANAAVTGGAAIEKVTLQKYQENDKGGFGDPENVSGVEVVASEDPKSATVVCKNLDLSADDGKTDKFELTVVSTYGIASKYSFTLNVDKTAPKNTGIIVKNKTKNTDDTTGKLTTKDPVVITVNGVSDTNLVKKATVTQVNADGTEKEIKKAADSDNSLFTSDDKGVCTFSYTVPEDDLSGLTTAKYKVTFYDEAGNTNDIMTPVTFYSEDIVISGPVVSPEAKYKNGENSYFNTPFLTLTYNITSDAKIDFNKEKTEATVTTQSGDKEKYVAKLPENAPEPSYNKDDGTYTYKYTLNIAPADDKAVNAGSLSDLLSSITLDVTNINGIKYSEKNSGSPYTTNFFHIDLSNPDISADSAANQTDWYSSVILMITYGDNKAANIEAESGIKEASATNVNGKSSMDITSSDSPVSVTVNPSTSMNGTNVVIKAVDNVGNEVTKTYTYHVDSEAPAASISVNKKQAAAVNGNYLGKASGSSDPSVSFSVDDNIQLKNYSFDVKTPGGTVRTISGGAVKSASSDVNAKLSDFLTAEDLINGLPKDGVYTITLTGSDNAGTVINGGTISTSFTLDNTVPVTDMTVATAKPAKIDQYGTDYYNAVTKNSYRYGQYYNVPVSINLSAADNNLPASQISVTDNGNPVKTSWSGDAEKKAYVTISGEGKHSILITAVDNSGNKTVIPTVDFTIDYTKPVITTVLNGTSYTEGTRYLNANGVIGVKVNETNKDDNDLTRTTVITQPSAAAVSTTEKVSEGDHGYTTDADYNVKYVAVDRAGNVSDERAVTFRVDKAAPQLKITGAGDNSTSTKDVTLNFGMDEAFYWDMNSAVIKIYRSIDGQSESLLRTVDYKASNAKDIMAQSFSDDGEYRFEFEAEDKCGNKADTSYTFILDKNAPFITLSVKNYTSTKKPVEFGVSLTEGFFKSNNVTLKGTRTDLNGKSEDLKFDSYNFNGQKESDFKQTFKKDGIYDITVSAKDKAGNKSFKKVHFTIDNTKPVIGDLKEYDGTVVNKFSLSANDKNLYSDLTSCNVKIYLDGVEYDGVSDIEDGSHTIRVTASDELGNEAEKEATFVLDTKAPNILITGVKDGDTVKDPVTVNASVQLKDDVLESVTLNGKAENTNSNSANFTVNKKGTYKIVAKAHDKAGNKSTVEITFNYGSKFNWAVFGIVLGAVVVAGGAVYIIVVKVKKGSKKTD